MDRQIIYPGQIPLETDLLLTNRNTMIALGKLIGSLLGTAGVVNGLAVAPHSPAALSVVVAAGEIYQVGNVDNTAYSSLPADTTDTCVKQGIQLQPVTIACPAPATAGFSINYLIEATFSEVDGGATVLPYYNASNPAQAYSGPANSGASQSTVRAGTVVVQAKAGIAATTGTQVTPTVDAGYIALAVVTVANGQSTITSGNIVAVASTSVLTNSLLGMINTNSVGRLLNIQVVTSTATYVPTPGTKNGYVRVQAGGGAGGGVVATSAGNTSAGLGGAAGAYAEGFYPVASLTGQTMTIGAGGIAVTGSAGGGGGSTSFGSLITCPGGPGGGPGQNSTPPWNLGETGNSSTATGGNVLNSAGTSGSSSISVSTASIISGRGGTSPFGAGGGQVGTVSSGGIPGNGFGSGGGGALNATSQATTRMGGNGAPGIIVVEEYA